MERDWRDERIGELEAQLRERDARIAELEQRLTKQLAELTERLGQNSSNSHLPPSSDSPDERRKRNEKKKWKSSSKKKRGAQRGHQGAHRELLPPDKVNKFVDLFPSECENCWRPLPRVPDPSPRRYQQTELPPVEPETTEWRRHSVTCSCCGYKTRAAYDENVIPSSAFGPRLMAIIALVTGVYHVSRRKAVGLLSDLLGVELSLGALSQVEARVGDAVKPAVDEAWNKVAEARVKHTDGTSWSQAGVAMALWTIATTAVTVFKILADSTKDTLASLHASLDGILFDYWHDFKAGKLTRETFVAWMAPVREQVETLLAQAVAADIAGLSGSCADILLHKAALFTFVEHDGVEPTNNHAEREIRAFVLWRRRSFGSQSIRGNIFAESLMTVAHTARKQQRNVLAFLTECCRARAEHRSAPSLFDAQVLAAA